MSPVANIWSPENNRALVHLWFIPFCSRPPLRRLVSLSLLFFLFLSFRSFYIFVCEAWTYLVVAATVIGVSAHVTLEGCWCHHNSVLRLFLHYYNWFINRKKKFKVKIAFEIRLIYLILNLVCLFLLCFYHVIKF